MAADLVPRIRFDNTHSGGKNMAEPAPGLERSARSEASAYTTAFITGAASGIGLGLATAFSAAGLKVAMADIDFAGATQAAQRILAAGGVALPVKLDVTDAESWKRAAAKAGEALGAIDIVCANAGRGFRPAPIDDIPLEEWHSTLAVNLTGVFLAIKAFMPTFRARRQGGHFVITASLSSLIPSGNGGAYAASKFGVLGLAETLRQNAKPMGVGVSVLFPGTIRTNIWRNLRKLEAASLEGGADEAELRRLQSLADTGMDPVRVGEIALEAIRSRRFYVYTHPEYSDVIGARLGKLQESLTPKTFG